MLLFPFVSLGIHNLSVRMFPTFKDEGKGHNGLLFFLLVGVLGGYLFFLVIAFILKPFIISLLASESALIQQYWIYLLPLAGLTLVGAIFTQWVLNFKKIVLPAIFNLRVLSFIVYINIIKEWNLRPNWSFLSKPLKREMGQSHKQYSLTSNSRVLQD